MTSSQASTASARSRPIAPPRPREPPKPRTRPPSTSTCAFSCVSPRYLRRRGAARCENSLRPERAACCNRLPNSRRSHRSPPPKPDPILQVPYHRSHIQPCSGHPNVPVRSKKIPRRRRNPRPAQCREVGGILGHHVNLHVLPPPLPTLPR